MTTLAIKWAMRYHHLEVHWFDSLDQAVASAGYADDDGQEALDCIEVWDDNGHRVLSTEEVWTLWREMEKRREAAAPEPKPVVARLFVTSPGGDRICYSTYTSYDRIREDAERLREHLGDRVEIIDGPGSSAPLARAVKVLLIDGSQRADL